MADDFDRVGALRGANAGDPHEIASLFTKCNRGLPWGQKPSIVTSGTKRRFAFQQTVLDLIKQHIDFFRQWAYRRAQGDNGLLRQIDDYIKKIDAIGGTLKAIEDGYVQKEIQDSAYRFQKEIESNERVYVGINRYTMEEPPPTNLLKVDPKQREIETEKLKKLRAERDQKSWKAALDRLDEVSRTDENVMPAVIEAVKARATVGEVCDVWRNIWGEYRPKEFV